MSIGLGKVEKTILRALKRNGYMSIQDLSLVRIHGLNFFDTDIQDEVGSFSVPLFSSAIWQSTARAVRTLTRKGLVKCRKYPNPSGFKREFTIVDIA